MYYRNYEKHFRTQAERELSAIGDLKAGELVQWRKERLKDGFILFENPAFTGTVRRFFENPDDTAAREQTGTWLSKIQWHSQYERIRLLDPYGTTRMSVPEGLPPASSMIVQSIAKVFESGLVQFQDFYYNDNDNHIRLALFVPIFDRQNNDRPLGMVVMHIDPEQYLYPLISRWPTPSRTAESLLVRREGDEVLFLNSLRFKPGAAMRLR
ncbi:MAG TPA: hypothetical protein PK986_12880, partial [Spirochaetota bacterium]|nr:hypothetical protein [Spirochaetota bacterium]